MGRFEFCQSCGAKISVDAKFCPKCGTEIDKLLSHADGIDYAFSVTSGIITGLIDSLFVAKWDFEKAKALSNFDMNKKVMDFAKDKGYKGESLESAIKFLEKKFPLPCDGKYKEIFNEGTQKFDVIANNSHRLDDFCHHPALIGLICYLIVQFTGKTVYSDRMGSTFSSSCCK